MVGYKKGFSVIELLFVLVILATILLAISPFSREILIKNRAEKQVDSLKTAINFARISAVSRGEPIKLCASRSKSGCDGDWENGLIVITASNKVLRVLQRLSNGDKLKFNNGKKVIVFSDMGLANGYQGSFYYCPYNSLDSARIVTVAATGRVKISNKGAKGEIISCNF